MKPLTIFLVRHGQSESNLHKFFDGWYDSPLTDLGIKQASLLKKRLSKERIDAVFSSDLQRARRTVELLEMSVPVFYSSALREISYGELEGKVWADNKDYLVYHTDPYIRPNGGENAFDMQKRVIDYFEKVVLRSGKESVLIVSHHGPLVLLGAYLLGLPIENWRRLSIGNCGLSIFQFEEGVYRLKLWNSLSHLGLKSYFSLYRK